jgi:hypothetical protein
MSQDTGGTQADLRTRLRERALNQEAEADLNVEGKSLTLWMAAGFGEAKTVRDLRICNW